MLGYPLKVNVFELESGNENVDKQTDGQTYGRKTDK